MTDDAGQTPRPHDCEGRTLRLEAALRATREELRDTEARARRAEEEAHRLRVTMHETHAGGEGVAPLAVGNRRALDSMARTPQTQTQTPDDGFGGRTHGLGNVLRSWRETPTGKLLLFMLFVFVLLPLLSLFWPGWFGTPSGVAVRLGEAYVTRWEAEAEFYRARGDAPVQINVEDGASVRTPAVRADALDVTADTVTVHHNGPGAE